MIDRNGKKLVSGDKVQVALKVSHGRVVGGTGKEDEIVVDCSSAGVHIVYPEFVLRGIDESAARMPIKTPTTEDYSYLKQKERRMKILDAICDNELHGKEKRTLEQRLARVVSAMVGTMDEDVWPYFLALYQMCE